MKRLLSIRPEYQNVSVDIWDDTGELWEGYDVKEGKKMMRKLQKKRNGNEKDGSLRMYAEFHDLLSKNESNPKGRMYYFFDKNGKLKAESNNFCN